MFSFLEGDKKKETLHNGMNLNVEEFPKGNDLSRVIPCWPKRWIIFSRELLCTGEEGPRYKACTEKEEVERSTGPGGGAEAL